jgi:hypothetical protein
MASCPNCGPIAPDYEESEYRLAVAALWPRGDQNDHLSTGVAAMRAENERLRTEFVELLDEAKDMRSYVPDYFAKKWKHDEALERAIAVAAEFSQEDGDA